MRSIPNPYQSTHIPQRIQPNMLFYPDRRGKKLFASFFITSSLPHFIYNIFSFVPSSFVFLKKVPIIENTVCQDMFEHAGHKKKILSSFLCAGYANGQKDSCEVSILNFVFKFNVN
jgi:hypothetical protein